MQQVERAGRHPQTPSPPEDFGAADRPAWQAEWEALQEPAIGLGGPIAGFAFSNPFLAPAPCIA